MYSQHPHNTYPLVDSPGHGFSRVMGYRGWEKNKCSQKSWKFEKSFFFYHNKSTQLEGKESMPSQQVIIDTFLFNSVSCMIEQRLI